MLMVLIVSPGFKESEPRFQTGTTKRANKIKRGNRNNSVTAFNYGF
jgi:hypothetical protein